MSGQEKNWGTEYRRHRRKGMDANDAAVRADQWLERQDRKWHDMGYETARFEAEVRMEARADKAESALQAALAREAGLREALGNIIRERANAEWPLNVRADNMATIAGQALAALDGDGSEVLAEWKPTHRHKKTGGLYRVVGHGINEADMSPAVVYENKDRIVWIRPHGEFHDGRFEALDKLQEKRDARTDQ